jgi:hypothetical protein
MPFLIKNVVYVQLYKHFLQLQDYNDRVKTAEQRLQVISHHLSFFRFSSSVVL